MTTPTFSTIITIVILALSFTVASPVAAQSTECADLEDYQTAIITAIPRDDMETLFTILDKDMERVRPSEFAEASKIMDDWAEAISDMPSRDVPTPAKAYHAAFIDYLSVSSSVLSAMATGNMFSAVAYTDTIDEIALEMDAANRAGERKCDDLWPFSDTEGDTL